ncbi:MAG TPA: Fic family protein [Egicoccus sp.]|nr:Fic family protein [Egicoccus sp.]HSK25205.1 Fic family protein [Egicoccus sp.]
MLTEHTRSPHLAALLAAADDAAAALRTADPAAPAAAERRRAALLATLRLDGSPLTTWPDDAALALAVPDAAQSDPAAADPATTDGQAPGGWLDTLRAFDEPSDDLLLAREAAGVAAADAADDLAAMLATAPADALGRLHTLLTRGLVAPDRAARLRTSEQAVHDGSVGRMLYFTLEPGALPPAFDALTAWLAGPAADLPPLLAAGILHLHLLHLHPYDAANGRLARAAARLWLRDHGLDPAGLAVPEIGLATDPLGYHEEVAQTLRRRDLTMWLERWAEAVVDGLRGSGLALGLASPPLDPAAIDGLGADFTIAEARDQLGLADLDTTRATLDAALAAGLIQRVPGSRGLRFRRATD